MLTEAPVPLSELLKRKHAWLREMNALMGVGPLQSALEVFTPTLPRELIEEATGGLWGAIERAWRRLLARLTLADALDADGIRGLLKGLEDVQDRIQRWKKERGADARKARAQVKRGDLDAPLELARRLDEIEALEPVVVEHKERLLQQAAWLDELERVVVAAVPLDAAALAWGPPSKWTATPEGFASRVGGVEREIGSLRARLDELPREIQADTYLRDRLLEILKVCRLGRVRMRTLAALEGGDMDELTDLSVESVTRNLSTPDPDPVQRSTDPETQAYAALLGLVRREAADTLPPPGVHPSEQPAHEVVEVARAMPPDFSLGTDTPDVGAPPPADTEGSKRLAGLLEQAAEALVGALDHLPEPIERLCGAVAASDAQWAARRAAYGNLLATHWQIPLIVRALSDPLARAPDGEAEDQRQARAQRLSSLDDLRACLYAIGAGAVPPTARARRMTPAVRDAVAVGIEDFDRRVAALDERLRGVDPDTKGDLRPPDVV